MLAHKTDPDVILGLRYKIAKQTSGEIATVSILDVRGSERKQDTGQYTLDDLRPLLRRSILTMRVGEHAYTEIMLKWATRQPTGADADSSSP